MDDKSGNSIIDSASFQADGYLSPSQKQIAFTKSKDAKTFEDQSTLSALIDSFVRSNGKADTKYLELYNALNDVSSLCTKLNVYPVHVSETIPFSYAMLYYDFLILTGVISEDDIEEMRQRAMSVFGGEQKIAKA